MPLTTPRTWVVGETVTAAMLNTQVRDQFTSLIADRIFKVKTTQTTRTSSTLADDSTLTATVVANATYRMEAYLIVSADHDDADIALDWSFPTGATGSWATWGVGTPATSDTASIRVVETQDFGASRNLGVLTAARLSIRPVGTLVTGASGGTFALQWARVTSPYAVTIHAHSWLALTREL